MAFGTETSRQCPSHLLLILALTHAPICYAAAQCLDSEVNYPSSYQSIKEGGTVTLICTVHFLDCWNNSIEWYQAPRREIKQLRCPGSAKIQRRQTEVSLTFTNAKTCLSGIYYCTTISDHNHKPGCGIELEVVEDGPIDLEALRRKYAMKDMLIVAQGLLLALCLSLPALLFFNRRLDAELEEEEEDMDHMYEGLEALQSAMYEDIGNVRLTSKKMSTGEQPHQ